MYGDTMYDLALETSKKLTTQKNKEYVLMTLHRDINTSKDRLIKIIKGLSNINHKIIWPIHPKLKKILNIQKIKISENIKIIEPISYKKNLSLNKNANFVITDSGGIQKESYFLGKYSFILRKETEWQEIVKDKKSFIIDCEIKKIKKYKIDNKKFIPKKFLFGNGNTSEKIIKLLKKIK
jgi:UDP-GlcNAc3NAcA epimerase